MLKTEKWRGRLCIKYSVKKTNYKCLPCCVVSVFRVLTVTNIMVLQQALCFTITYEVELPHKEISIFSIRLITVACTVYE